MIRTTRAFHKTIPEPGGELLNPQEAPKNPSNFSASKPITASSGEPMEFSAELKECLKMIRISVDRIGFIMDWFKQQIGILNAPALTTSDILDLLKAEPSILTETNVEGLLVHAILGPSHGSEPNMRDPPSVASSSSGESDSETTSRKRRWDGKSRWGPKSRWDIPASTGDSDPNPHYDILQRALTTACGGGSSDQIQSQAAEVRSVLNDTDPNVETKKQHIALTDAKLAMGNLRSQITSKQRGIGPVPASAPLSCRQSPSALGYSEVKLPIKIKMEPGHIEDSDRPSSPMTRLAQLANGPSSPMTRLAQLASHVESTELQLKAIPETAASKVTTAVRNQGDKDLVMAASKALGWPYTDKYFGTYVLCFGNDAACPLSPSYTPNYHCGLRVEDGVFKGGIWGYYTYRKLKHFKASALLALGEGEGDHGKLRQIASRLKTFTSTEMLKSLAPSWRETECFSAMRTALDAVYKAPTGHSDVREALLRTERHLLVYCDPHNTSFSIGWTEAQFRRTALTKEKDSAQLCRLIARKDNDSTACRPVWWGENRLGFMLMTIRDEILNAAYEITLEDITLAIPPAQVVHVSTRAGDMNAKLGSLLDRTQSLTQQSPLSSFHAERMHEFVIGSHKYLSVYHFVMAAIFESIGLPPIADAVRKATSASASLILVESVRLYAGKSWNIPGSSKFCFIPKDIVSLIDNWMDQRGGPLLSQAMEARLEQHPNIADQLASTRGALLMDTFDGLNGAGEGESVLSCGMCPLAIQSLIRAYRLSVPNLFSACVRKNRLVGLTRVGGNLSGLALTQMRLLALQNMRLKIHEPSGAGPNYTSSLQKCEMLRYFLSTTDNSYFCLNDSSCLSCVHEGEAASFMVNGATYFCVYQFYYAELFYNIGQAERTVAIQRATSVADVRRIIDEARGGDLIGASDDERPEGLLEELMVTWKERCGPPSLRQAFRAVLAQNARFREELLKSEQMFIVDAGLMTDDELCVGMSDFDFRKYIATSGMDVVELAGICFQGGRDVDFNLTAVGSGGPNSCCSLLHIGANLSGLMLTELRSELKYGQSYSSVVQANRSPPNQLVLEKLSSGPVLDKL